jgi:hypothetical protein
VAVLGLSTFGALGCEYTPKTTVTVRDPSAVRVEVDDGHGLRTLLSPSSQPSESVEIPMTEPPYEPGVHQKTTLQRETGGAIEVLCGECAPNKKVLFPADGKLVLGDDFLGGKIDFTKSELRIRFTDDRAGPWDSFSTYNADAVTPWKNVALVERVSTPSRTVGGRLLITAAVVGALGAFSLIDGVGNHHTTTTVFGAVFLPISAFLFVGGGWYAFAPADEKVLFKGKSE